MTYNPSQGGGSGVSSVFGRSGSVSAAASDYTFAQIGSKPTTRAGYGITDAAADAHSHAAGDLASGTVAIARIPLGSSSSTVCVGNDARLSDARTPTAHTHAAAEITSGTIATARLGSGTADGSSFLRGDQTWAAASGGSDPWTYVRLMSDFTTTSASAVDSGLTFAPQANTRYEFYGFLMVRTATATVNPRVGLAWPTGGTDGVAMVYESQAATTAPLNANGNINAALLVAVGGLPNTTQSWPVGVEGLFIAGSSPSGSVRIQLASETAGTTVRLVAGSFLRYRTIP